MKVSIIVPIYNIDKYIGNCIDSLVSQTYSNIEIILIDDGSTDCSASICLDYQNNYSNIVKYYYKKNGGLSDARNYGLSKATGDSVLFIDGDDYISEDAIKLLVQNMKKNYSDIVLFSHKSKYTNDKIVEHNLFDLTYSESTNLINIVYPRLFGLIDTQLSTPLDSERYNTAWGKLYSRNVLKNVKFLDTKEIGTEDAWFNINVFAHCNKITFCRNAYYFYNRNVMTSLTRNYNSSLFSGWKRLYSMQEEFINMNNLSCEFFESLHNRIVLNLFGLISNIINSNLNLRKKIKEIDNILNDELYEERFYTFKFNNLPLIWNIFYRLAYIKSSLGVYIFIKLAYFLKGN